MLTRPRFGLTTSLRGSTLRVLCGAAASLGVLAACSSDPEKPPAQGTSGSAGQATSGAAGAAARGGSGVGGSAGSAVSSGGSGNAGKPGGGAGGSAGSGAPPPAGAAGVPPMGAGGSTGGGAGAGANGGAAGGLGGMPNVDGGRGGQPGGGTGNAGASSGGAWGICPDGVTGVPMLTGTPMRVTSVPPKDSFNNNNNDWGNVEGPVWIGDSLYVSEMSSQAYGGQGTPDSEIKKSRILKVSSSGQTSIWVADSGSNGLAVDAQGNIVAAVHKDGSIQRFAVPAGTASPVATMFMGARFNSPNDLVIHSNGTIYFTDPTYNGPATPPQSAMRAYRIPAGGQPEPIPSAASPDTFTNPNGITLSPAEDFLYVAANTGRRYPVMPDGTLGAGQDFAPLSSADGVTVDCAGNLYVVTTGQPTMKAYKPDGSSIGTLMVSDVQALTNVAFGGADHKTLYLTGYGTNKGLFQLTLNIPGRPY